MTLTFNLKKQWFKVNVHPLTTGTILIDSESLLATGKRKKYIPDMDLQRSTMALTFELKFY